MAVEKAEIEREQGRHVPCLFNPTQFRMAKSNIVGLRPGPGQVGTEPVLLRRRERHARAQPRLRHDRHRHGGDHAHQRPVRADGGRSRPARLRRRHRTGPTPVGAIPVGELRRVQVGDRIAVGRVHLLRVRRHAAAGPGVAEPVAVRGRPVAGFARTRRRARRRPARSHVVQAGEPLDAITARYYGPPPTGGSSPRPTASRTRSRSPRAPCC